jgi:HSP20 family protein
VIGREDIVQNMTQESRETQKPSTSKVERADKRTAPALEPRIVSPPVDILEGTDEILVYTDLPGAKVESISLSAERETLTLTAEREEEQIGRPTLYKRTFFVGSELDVDATDATFEDGVLTLRVPRRAAFKARSIPVHG